MAIHVNLELLIRSQFDAAKYWLNLATLCSIVILVINIIVSATNWIAPVFALIVAVLTICASICTWRSARLRDSAESILRKFETHNAFGWEISAKELSDVLVSSPQSVKKAARTVAATNTYFTSQLPVDPVRALENLEESAWWTKHQAQRMAQYTAIFSTILIVVAFATLIVALQSAVSETLANSIAQFVIIIIVFLFSGEYIRTAFDYRLFAEEAQRTENDAYELRRRGQVTEVEAIKLLHDYQIVRATSPLLPSWLWKIVQHELNTLWNERAANR